MSLGIRTVFESSLGRRRPPPSIGEALLKSLLRFSYSCELELGTTRLLEHKLVARKCHQVNRRREWRLDFDSVLIAELVSAANFSDEHGAVAQKFPNCLIFSSRHPPFADDAGISAADHDKKQNCRTGCQQQTRVSRKPKSHQPSYNRAGLSGRAKAKFYFWVACAPGGRSTYV